MTIMLEIQIIAILISVACALIGSFLVLKNMSMMTDSITHTILLGIVIAYFIVKDLNSPFLIIGATAMGVFTVWITELVLQSKLVSKDSAIGLVFPFLFSIAIILISKYAGNTHLDVDSVLLGELAFAPFNRFIIFGIDIGAKALYTSGIVLILNIIFIKLFFKELKITIFDPIFATIIGISPLVMHYSLMTMVSLTTVVAFETVGSVLVIAFMIVPAVCANLLTDNLKVMLILSSIFAVISAILGFKIAIILDVSIAGAIAVVLGIIFMLVFLFSPKYGVVSKYLKL